MLYRSLNSRMSLREHLDATAMDISKCMTQMRFKSTGQQTIQVDQPQDVVCMSFVIQLLPIVLTISFL